MPTWSNVDVNWDFPVILDPLWEKTEVLLTHMETTATFIGAETATTGIGVPSISIGMDGFQDLALAARLSLTQ